MQVLITGALTSSAWLLADYLARDYHEVLLLGTALGTPPERSNVPHRDLSVYSPNVSKVYEAGHFDAVLYLMGGMGGVNEDASGAGVLLDGLTLALRLSEAHHVGVFALVSDYHVFGVHTDRGENDEPMPDTPLGVLQRAAEQCLFTPAPTALRRVLIRAGLLYDVAGDFGLPAQAAKCSAAKQNLLLPVSASGTLDLMHLSDFARLVSLILDHEQAQGVYHACGTEALPARRVSTMLKARFPKLNVMFSDGSDACVTGQNARRQLDFVPTRRFEHDLTDATESAPPPRKRLVDVMRRVNGVLGKGLPWLELVLGASLMWLLNHVTETYATYRFVDFRLLFVVCIASAHGTLLGLAASLIACFSYGVGFVGQGGELLELLYNADNWLPIAAYLLAGALLGYMRAKHLAQTAFWADELKQQREANAFMQTMYIDSCASRDSLAEQMIRYRDSYGRIYRIVSALDSMQPTQVFFSALGVIEDAMSSQSVALYTIAPDSTFARLVICSRGISETTAKSLNLKAYPDLLNCVKAGKAYGNNDLRPGYPAYMVPMFMDDKPFALAFLWDASFEQHSLYYQNLFSIVCGLAQTSLIRASMFYDAVAGDLYEAGTRIMTRSAYEQTLQVYSEMHEKHLMDYLRVRVPAKQTTRRGFDTRIERCIRASDIAGRLADGGVEVLMPQADENNQDIILDRFERADITGVNVIIGEADAS